MNNYTNIDQLPLTLTAPMIADILHIGRTNAYALLRRPDFPSINIGRRKVVAKSNFLKWLEQNSELTAS